jgi:membrane associated rhomboid family serine protease/cytochrome c-type biogenesis protein CcmH/NrfG
MRQAPELKEFPRYPVIAGIAMLAMGVTFAWWAKVDISPLFETAMIRRGEPWRLVTSMLPHVGIWHLAFNIYWLWVFGTLVEEVYGHLKTAALILLFAFGSGAFEFAFSAGGVGLSGVGYGLFGLLWVLSSLDNRFRDAIDQKTVQLFVAWFFFCIFTTAIKIMPIANIAHGSGAVLGVVTGFAISLPSRRLPITAGLVSILLFCLWAATLGRPVVNLSGEAGYEEAMWGYDALLAKNNQESVRWFSDAVRYQPKNAEYWYDLGIANQRLGKMPDAMVAYRKAADQGNSDAQYYLGIMYETGGENFPKDNAQALYWFRKAADQDNAEAQNSVAWTYATSSDPSIRNPSAALEFARKAVSSEKDQPEPNHLDTLAEAYYANRDYKNAITTEKQAIASADPESSRNFQKSLEKYQRAMRDGEPQAK